MISSTAKAKIAQLTPLAIALHREHPDMPQQFVLYSVFARVKVTIPTLTLTIDFLVTRPA